MSDRIYLVPGISQLMRAPRMGDLHNYAPYVTLGWHRLNCVIARIDYRNDNVQMGDGQAMTLFSMVRKTVAETIQLN